MTVQGNWPGVGLDGVPNSLARRMRDRAPEGTSALEFPEDLSRALAQAAVEQLRDSDPGAVRDQDAAMDLLAADGLLTAACQVALAAERPTEMLVEILKVVVRNPEKEFT